MRPRPHHSVSPCACAFAPTTVLPTLFFSFHFVFRLLRRAVTVRSKSSGLRASTSPSADTQRHLACCAAFLLCGRFFCFVRFRSAARSILYYVIAGYLPVVLLLLLMLILPFIFQVRRKAFT